MIAEIVPAGEKGIAKVEHYEIPKGYLDFHAAAHGYESPDPGKHVKLTVNGVLTMSDTAMEWRSNSWILSAKGDVLVAGLGIGLVLTKLLTSKRVNSVLVIEKHQDVIDLVAPYYRDKRLTVECADIMDWRPPTGAKWDCIWFDIWENISEDNLNQINKLHRRFKGRKRPGGFMDSWMAARLRRNRR